MGKSTIAPEPRSTKGKSFPSRQFKVRTGHYDYQFNRSRRSRPYKAPVPVPWVQVKGYWLNEAGFSIGTAVSVDVHHGRLILTAIPNSTPG